MSETKSAATGSGLFAALAELQAQMPAVGKGQEGEVKGEKDGRQYAYKYKYADLTDVSSALLPLMGRLGLAFTAKPTVNSAGQFVLAYKLVHGPSGESDEGEYLLPSPERVKPQQLGSFITYARRYSLCAVTGLAPGGDDDDGQSAQQAEQDAWEHATPAKPRRSEGNGHVSRPVAQQPASPAQAADGEPDEEAQEIAVLAHEARTLGDLSALHRKAHDAGKLTAVVANPATGGKGTLGPYLNWRRQQVQAEARALAELTRAGEAAGLTGDVLDERVRELTGTGIEGASVAQMKEAAAALAAGAPA